MATEARQPSQAPPAPTEPTPIILPGAAGGVAGTVPGAAAAAASMAAGVGGEAAIANVATKAGTAILSVLTRLSRRRHQAMRERLLAAGTRLGDVDQAMQGEDAREKIYKQRSEDRVKAGMKLALAASDASTRAEAIQKVLRREQRFAQMRASASAERVLASAEREELRRISPKGALWLLGKRKSHTQDCLAMAGRFWPWGVLDEVHPLLHPGCGCYLISLGAAISQGLMAPGDIPTDSIAHRLAAGVIAHVRAEKAEAIRKYGLEEEAGRELAIRERLVELGVGDRDLLACAPLRCDAELLTQDLSKKEVASGAVTLTSDQQRVVDEAPVPVASDGQSLAQAIALGVKEALLICELQGYGQPDEADVKAALEAKGKSQPVAPS